MQHAEQPALLGEEVEWLHAHEGAAKGPGIQAPTREVVCTWRRPPSVTIGSFPVQRQKREVARRLGNECVSTCRSRWSPYNYKHKYHCIVWDSIYKRQRL